MPMAFQNFALPLGVSVLRFALYVLLRETSNTEYQTSELPPSPSRFFDFIVVGSGAAGAVVAARLSENPSWNVLLLEAGGTPPAETYIPGLDILSYVGEADWDYRVAPQEHSMFGYEGRSNRYPRGHTLGGSSSINYMMYVRGNRRDYDNWVAMGNPGWDYQTVLHYFKKSEHFTAGDSEEDAIYHGYQGPMEVSQKKWGAPLGKTFLKAGLELGFDVNDHNAAKQTGFSIPHLTIKDGLRHSTAEAFLRPNLHRENLHILTHSRVTKVILDDHGRAVGVKYLHKGKEQVSLSKREVIICAGAINSPQILLLSGIGPKEHLEEMGIPVHTDLPGVGQNLHDHPVIFGITWLVNKGSSLSISDFIRPGALMDYFKRKTGPYSVPLGVEGNAWVSLNETTHDWPDTQYLLFSATPTFDKGLLFADLIGYRRELFNEYFKSSFGREGFCLGPTLMRPKSRGSITLRSPDPLEAPIIDPKFLSHPEDLALMVEAIKFSRRIGDSKAMKDLHGAKFLDVPLPGCDHHVNDSDEYLACYARFMTSTIYHPVGTCKMAPYDDKMGVVDNRLRVRGIKGLRVIDASIMPQIVSGNTNAPSIMIGERGADLVKEDWDRNYVRK